MRTFLALSVGLILSFAVVFASHFLGKTKLTGALVFMGLWLAFCVVDFTNGVKAGYSAREEFIIHALIFLLPALAAWLSARFL